MNAKSIFALSFCAALISGCGKSPAEEDFTKACTTGQSERVCSCVFDGLEKYYGADTIAEMHSSKRVPSDFSGTVGKGMMACRYKYDE